MDSKTGGRPNALTRLVKDLGKSWWGSLNSHPRKSFSTGAETMYGGRSSLRRLAAVVILDPGHREQGTEKEHVERRALQGSPR